MHFYWVFKLFMPKKAFAYGAAPRRLDPPQEVHLYSRFQFLALGPVHLLRLQYLATPV